MIANEKCYGRPLVARYDNILSEIFRCQELMFQGPFQLDSRNGP